MASGENRTHEYHTQITICHVSVQLQAHRTSPKAAHSNARPARVMAATTNTRGKHWIWSSCLILVDLQARGHKAGRAHTIITATATMQSPLEKPKWHLQALASHTITYEIAIDYGLHTGYYNTHNSRKKNSEKLPDTFRPQFFSHHFYHLDN